MLKTAFGILLALLLCTSAIAAKPKTDTIKTALKAKQALFFCKQKGYNAHYCVLIDMGLPSGVNRFMVWDFEKKNILLSGLVSHGCGRNPWSGVWSKNNPSFSNKDGSHCTALGKYVIHGRANSNWGIHIKYFLSGLDTSNSNSLKRQVVFHSWEKVSEAEVYPDGTAEGWGCPAISNKNMNIVDALLQKQKKNLLMWIYN